MLDSSVEALEKWITIKVGMVASLAVSGAGVASAQEWLAILGAIAAFITALAGLMRILRETLEIRRGAREEQRRIDRERREEVRDLNLMIKKIRPEDRLPVAKERRY